MQIDFPCDDASWDAADALSWKAAIRRVGPSPPPSFRNALRDLAGRGIIAPDLTDMSLWLLLHGLVSVSWTLLWRDLGELSMIHDNTITRWKDSLRRAFGVWRDHVGRLVEDRTRAGETSESLVHVSWSGVLFAHLGESLDLVGITDGYCD
jgi:hypothetical protein